MGGLGVRGGGDTCTLIPREWTDEEKFPCPSPRELRAFGGTPRRLGSEQKRQFVARLAYLNTRPRLFFLLFLNLLSTTTTKNPLKERSEPGPALRACSLHSWELEHSSPAPAHKTKAFQIRRNVGAARFGSPPPAHRSQNPPENTRNPAHPARPALGFACLGLSL